MISALASVVLAIALNIKLPLIAPVVYLLGFWRKDAFLVGFLFYSLFLSYEFTAENIYAFNFSALSLVLATVLLLEEGLNIRRRSYADFILAFSMLLGFIFIEALFSLLVVSLIYVFYHDKPKKGILVLGCIFLLGLIFIYLRQDIGHIGSSATQAIVISAVSAILCIFWLRRI